LPRSDATSDRPAGSLRNPELPPDIIRRKVRPRRVQRTRALDEGAELRIVADEEVLDVRPRTNGREGGDWSPIQRDNDRLRKGLPDEIGKGAGGRIRQFHRSHWRSTSSPPMKG
jgi:hypothetical protein